MAERISTPSRTKQIIEENGFYFKRILVRTSSLTATFWITSQNAPGVTKEDCVLEIGPGIGSLNTGIGRTLPEKWLPLKSTAT